MALIKKDRSFDDILNDVVMNELPVKYIDSIVVHLDDGSSILFTGSDLQGLDQVTSVLDAEDMEQYRDMVVDIQITMDAELIKESVTEHVSALLAFHFDNK